MTMLKPKSVKAPVSAATWSVRVAGTTWFSPKMVPSWFQVKIKVELAAEGRPIGCCHGEGFRCGAGVFDVDGFGCVVACVQVAPIDACAVEGGLGVAENSYIYACFYVSADVSFGWDVLLSY